MSDCGGTICGVVIICTDNRFGKREAEMKFVIFVHNLAHRERILVPRPGLCYTAKWRIGGIYMEKIRTTVRVAGKDYTIASYDSEAHVQRVAAYVDRKLSELSMATRLPQAQLSVLAALNIADDMLKAHDEITRLRRELMETQRQLEAARK